MTMNEKKADQRKKIMPINLFLIQYKAGTLYMVVLGSNDIRIFLAGDDSSKANEIVKKGIFYTCNASGQLTETASDLRWASVPKVIYQLGCITAVTTEVKRAKEEIFKQKLSREATGKRWANTQEGFCRDLLNITTDLAESEKYKRSLFVSFVSKDGNAAKAWV
ncbi:hypothetical protein PNOK_0937400 [Pyrrhoderma noxium]|uniref:Uncharacterized protein n=1 Tax=Pyrrhoderma noxium TaxID=2282107 RepID=A0A286U5G2_9AGAM|nr:hypothetical protein PNOK_0937400 [Pyrrhoderma noxium]